ncbi:hypothetical protein [Kitasatospora purpeofusca]|uniref:hypothetical protein n=1 Tax=Kitasatospora purpeofusca TaxID=67352 RepID=UPI002A5993F8|nr:hypothetical protein [Kitasatospora purpeofusca]MDY0810571.1 hypothetical protein [Kitasatospora purpeofusca]
MPRLGADITIWLLRWCRTGMVRSDQWFYAPIRTFKLLRWCRTVIVRRVRR